MRSGLNLKWQIAFRNVLRNGRRTVLNVTMIATGIAAIVVFKGFSNNIVGKLEWVAINNQYGHLQLASDRTWNLSAKDKLKDRLIRIEPSLIQKIERIGGVAYSSGRLPFYGMVNNGEQTLSARGIGFDPGKEKALHSSYRINEGRNLTKDSKFEILLGQGLRDQIGMQVGSSVTLMAYTVDGSVNAIDAELVGIFQSGLAEIDNSTFLLPLETAQKLLDTDGIERLVVQLEKTGDTERVKAALQDLHPPGVSPRGWSDLAVFYRQVMDYFRTQNLIIEWILMVLALLSIGNIVGMSIAERTGEIGTMRAMGDSRWIVISNFLIEGVILGVLGGIVGCIFGFAVAVALNAAKVPILTPGASLPLAVEVDILPLVFVEAFLLMCLMAVVATLIPAMRASRIEIVEALKRNI